VECLLRGSFPPCGDSLRCRVRGEIASFHCVAFAMTIGVVSSTPWHLRHQRRGRSQTAPYTIVVEWFLYSHFLWVGKAGDSQFHNLLCPNNGQIGNCLKSKFNVHYSTMNNHTNDFYISVDVETSGPNPSQYSLLSIGACTIFEPVTTFYVELKPMNERYLESAMMINRLSFERLKENGEPPEKKV